MSMFKTSAFKATVAPKDTKADRKSGNPAPSARLNNKFDLGRELLENAQSSSDDAERLFDLLELEVDINTKDKTGKTALHYVVINNKKKSTQLLCTWVPDWTLLDQDKLAAIHYAIKKGNEDILKILLEAKCFVEVVDGDNFTPLHWAAIQNFSRGVEMLLHYEANANAQDKFGNTPLFYACYNGHKDSASMLLTYHADPNAKNKSGDSSLHAACSKNYVHIIDILITEAKGDVNVKNADGDTALHTAVKKEQVDVILHLYSLGAKIKTKNLAKQRPFDNVSDGLLTQIKEKNQNLHKKIMTIKEEAAAKEDKDGGKEEDDHMQDGEHKQRRPLPSLDVKHKERNIGQGKDSPRGDPGASSPVNKDKTKIVRKKSGPGETKTTATTTGEVKGTVGGTTATKTKQTTKKIHKDKEKEKEENGDSDNSPTADSDEDEHQKPPVDPLPPQNVEIDIKEIRLGVSIGKGANGEVYKGFWRGTEVAVKKIHATLNEKDLKEFRSEIVMMTKLRHPNIVLFMGASTKPPTFAIITELLKRGSLWNVLHDKNIQLSWDRTLSMAIDAAKGMCYLHLHKPLIMHRDLKSPNFLVDENFNLKVCDFGFTMIKDPAIEARTHCGTPQWMAPEILRYQDYNEKADIYSFGIVLWELVTRQVPYKNMGQTEISRKVMNENLRPKIPTGIPKEYCQLMEQCWDDEPVKRPIFEEILERLQKLQKK